jgi:hypothetical protein
MVVNAILDAPGAVLTTSTRPDALTVTLKARERVGPVAVFDPQHLAKGLPAGLRCLPGWLTVASHCMCSSGWPVTRIRR